MYDGSLDLREAPLPLDFLITILGELLIINAVKQQSHHFDSAHRPPENGPLFDLERSRGPIEFEPLSTSNDNPVTMLVCTDHQQTIGRWFVSRYCHLELTNLQDPHFKL